MSDVVLDPVRWELVEPGGSALVDRWLAAEGDHVRAGQVLARARLMHEIVDIEAPHDGILEQIAVPAGDAFGRGDVLAQVVRF